MPTSHKVVNQEGIKMAEIVKPAEVAKEQVVTQEDFQGFVAAFNAGIAGLVKPLREKLNLLEVQVKDLGKFRDEDSRNFEKKFDEDAKKIDEGLKKVDEELKKLIARTGNQQKTLEDTTGKVSQTALDLQELITRIPNITNDVKKALEIIQNFMTNFQAIFGQASGKAGEAAPQIKTVIENLAKPLEIEVKALQKASAPAPVPGK
jgi:methyl-accepting chemotaxis protein